MQTRRQSVTFVDKTRRSFYIIYSIYIIMGAFFFVGMLMMRLAAEKGLSPIENPTAMSLMLSSAAIAIVTGIVHAILKVTIPKDPFEEPARGEE